MSARPSAVREHLEYRLLRALFDHLRRHDLSRSLRRGRRLSRVSPLLARSQRKWGVKSLRLVFGQALDGARCRRLLRRVFENYFYTLVEGLRSDDVAISATGFDGLASAHAGGNGVIACGMHLGSWDVGLRQLSRVGLPTALVYRPARDARVRRLLHEARAGWGVRWIGLDDAWSAVRALRDGHVLCLLCDQCPGDRGVTAEFLGVPVRFPQGPARLGLRLGSPLVPVVHIREGPGRVRVHCEPPIDPRPSRDARAPASHLTRRLAAAFEPWVVEYAEQYNWCYPIWRQRPGGGHWRLADPNATIRGAESAGTPPLAARVVRLLA
jgi:KDO2-lipid IV(A) lauroyltransferase